MAQIVKPDPGKSGQITKSIVCPEHVPGIEHRPLGRREHAARFYPAAGREDSFFVLLGAVRDEGGNNEVRQPNRTLTLLGFGGYKPKFPLDSLQGATDIDSPVFKIDIR